MSGGTPYTGGFYDKTRAGAEAAARAVLPIVREIVPFRTVADIGCGTGAWLSVAAGLGAERAWGLEGTWAAGHRVTDACVEIAFADLERPIAHEARFDLAMSLEVAEHLSPGRAESFVADLCGLSSHVLFGAAIPGQGGRSHVNERPQSYWAGLFRAQGYHALDCIRPKIWNDPSVPVWYRQNTLLYSAAFEEQDGILFDIVHPRYAKLTRWSRRLGQQLGQAWFDLRRFVRRVR